MLITTIFYESHPFTCRGGFTTWHMSCFVRDVCTIRQFSTAPFFLQYFLIDFGFHRLSMCCELFPRIGFQITAIRYIGAHPGDLFGSDGTPSHTPGTQPVRQHMAYVSFRTASSIWLGQGFMDTPPVCHDVLIAVPDGFFPLGTFPQFSLYFFHESFAVNWLSVPHTRPYLYPCLQSYGGIDWHGIHRPHEYCSIRTRSLI